MKRLSLLLSGILGCICCIAQDTQCNFLKDIKFKNGVDTVVINATYMAIVQSPPPILSMVTFNKKQKLSGDIDFKPENCSAEYVVPLKRFGDKQEILNPGNLGLGVRLTCVVFEKYFHIFGKSPFFIVVKVEPLKPVGSKVIFSDNTLLKGCDFLKNLHFKNGKDTIIVKALFGFRSHQDSSLILKELDKKGWVNAKQLTGAIYFKMENCQKDYMAPVHFKDNASADFLGKQPESWVIYLTCIVFDKYYNYGEPYFIIDKWSFEKPN